MYQETDRGDVALTIGGEVHLLLDGELDVTAGPRMMLLTRAALSSGEHAVVLDLSAVTFMDCAGLRVVASARALLVAAGRAVTVPEPSAAVVRLLRWTAAGDLLGIDAPAPRPPAGVGA